MSILDAYKNAVDDVKKSMTDSELAEFEQNLAEERKLIEEHEKTMVHHDESEFIMDERGIDGGEEDNKYPEADNPEDLMKQTNEFMNPSGYAETVTEENDLKTERIEVKPVLVKAYCPKCGKEIVSTMPPLYNPFDFKKVNMHKCGDCGWLGNLEYSYPRVVFIDSENNEYEAYAK